MDITKQIRQKISYHHGRLMSELEATVHNVRSHVHSLKSFLYIDEDSAVFSVQNRGELIPTSAMPHLFNPQARYSSYAAKEKGTFAGLGLGLFIAAQIVSAHGGKTEVVSTVEQGTVFKVLLPIT